ncbi:nucleotidyl transferase AbiEii/AbiGii toxin family protein [Lentzea sp. NPDC051213]|uniref:nucleotidyl transferase AbiEii/AbiGii toxin family protein n=1 Tax=Lentzea sp. NPDC051213 TaxID=3364126 RepID=UPI0037A21E7B
MYSGEFELHLTGSEWQVDELAAFAGEHGVKFSHIELHRGEMPSQPMLTIGVKGTLDEVRAVADGWRARMLAAELYVVRIKIEAAPWNEGVPQSDEDADPALYFEHHVKLLLRGQWHRDVLVTVESHNAHISRNARRRREDYAEERFVTQRCFGVGRATAKAQLQALLDDLQQFEVLEIEEEYVVDDDALHVDKGWFEGRYDFSTSDERLRQAPPGVDGFPRTYQPLVIKPSHDIKQRAVFDPALKHFDHAFRGGEPKFGDQEQGARWLDARRKAMAHLLGLIGGSEWRDNLVLRGSAVMREWFGAAAREPGDLDFVVTPPGITVDGREAGRLIGGLVGLVYDDPGPGLRPEEAATEDIWTYDRVPGLRLVFPFDVEGLPSGAIQIDLVFNEELPVEPELLEIAGTTLLAANQELSLAWKIQWLLSDKWPQAKDLYDAALLAQHTTVRFDLVHQLMRPTANEMENWFAVGGALDLGDVDWDNAPSELPATRADEKALILRITAALR